jgi:TPR repeat protein
MSFGIKLIGSGFRQAIGQFAGKTVELANKACELTQWKNSDSIGTLAAAYAECGDFKEAVKWAKKAVELGNKGEKLRKQLKLHEEGKPYRDE